MTDKLKRIMGAPKECGNYWIKWVNEKEPSIEKWTPNMINIEWHARIPEVEEEPKERASILPFFMEKLEADSKWCIRESIGSIIIRGLNEVDARLIVAAVNAWPDLVKFLDENETYGSVASYDRLKDRVSNYQKKL